MGAATIGWTRTVSYSCGLTVKSDQYAYLINHPNPGSLASARQITLPATRNLPPVYRLDTLPNAAQLAANPTFDFAFPVGDTDVFMLKYTTAAVDEFAAPISHDWSLYLAHEGFHRHQMKHWHESRGDQDIANYPLTAENLALAMLENRVLVAGLSAEDAAARAVALQKFTAIRQLRIAQFPQVAGLDNPQEAGEGTARYLEHTLGELLGTDTYNLQTFDQELTMMQEPQAVESHVRDQFAFGRFYTTGAALSRLLDLQEIDWKSAISNGESHYAILLNHVDISDPTTLIAEAKQAHNYAELLELGTRGEAVAKTEPTDIFAADATAPKISQSDASTESSGTGVEQPLADPKATTGKTAVAVSNATLPTTITEFESLFMGHLKLTTQDELYAHFDNLTDADFINLIKTGVGLESDSEVEALLEQLFGGANDKGEDGKRGRWQRGRWQRGRWQRGRWRGGAVRHYCNRHGQRH